MTIVGVSVALAMAGAMALALARIRHARTMRDAIIAASAGVAIAFLVYLAFRPLGDPAPAVLPVLAALIVGTLDEWRRWFIPNRVGEARDVFLNLVAIVRGLAFGAALEPPHRFALRMPPRSRRIFAVVAAGFVLVFAGSVNAVHLGHLLRGPDVTFRSHYTLDELRQLSNDRTARWRVDPPLGLQRRSREDQYLDEDLWHILERSRRWEAEDYDVAVLENEILERHFAPVLDTRSYAAPGPATTSSARQSRIQS